MPLYKQKNSDIWWISLNHPDHPRLRRSSGTTDRKEAQRVHDELKAELWKVAPISHGKTWGSAVEAWLAIEDRSESELLSLRKFGQKFRDRPLSQVKGEDIEAALSFCETAGTYMRYRTTIVAILNVARKRGWLRELPAIPVRKDKKKKTREWITHEQWEKLYAELPEHLKGPARFAVTTGLRQANVFGLRWADVDLDRKTVVVYPEDAKGGKGIPVPLNDEAVETLQAQVGVHPEFVFAYRGRKMVKPRAGFTDACVRAGLGSYSADSRDGKTTGRRNRSEVDPAPGVRRNAHPDTAAKGGEESSGYTGFTWHGLRHTWATWHVQNGTPLDVLQKLGGWSDLRMVMNYAHHAPGYLAQFANNTRKRHG